MTNYIIRPTSLVSSGGGTNPASSATVLTNLGDNSDATLVNNTGLSSIFWAFGLGSPSIPGTEFVARVGTSLRWKGNSSGNYSIGGTVYRSTDPIPSGLYSLTPNNSAAFTSTEVGYQSVNWSPAEVSSLRYRWFDGRSSTSFAQTDHADLWATIYTLEKATATPSNKTETSSVYPTIPVSVSATIGFEAGTYDWQNLRKVTVEVRIESGGTTVGTGTLVSTATDSVFFNATGSQSLNVAFSDSVSNGTYKVYSRAIRYREDGVVYSDATGSWSASATLTMSAPPPNTPTVSVTSDTGTSTNRLTVTPIATTSYLGPFIYVERSDDGGSTWTPVRNAYGVAGTFGTGSQFIDYEAPRAQVVQYRAKVEATYSSSFINSSAYSTPVLTTLAANTWNIKDPANPNRNNIGIQVVGRPGESIVEDLGVFRPLGRRYPVVVAGTLGGWDGDLNILTTTSDEWATVKTLVEAQTILLLESLFGWSKYVRLLSNTQTELYGTASTARRGVRLTYVEVAQPEIVVGATSPTVTVPTLIDGGTASTITFDSSEDGGTSTSVYLAVADGGAAS